jgi:hypothetical protein
LDVILDVNPKSGGIPNCERAIVEKSKEDTKPNYIDG